MRSLPVGVPGLTPPVPPCTLQPPKTSPFWTIAGALLFIIVTGLGSLLLLALGVAAMGPLVRGVGVLLIVMPLVMLLPFVTAKENQWKTL